MEGDRIHKYKKANRGSPKTEGTVNCEEGDHRWGHVDQTTGSCGSQGSVGLTSGSLYSAPWDSVEHTLAPCVLEYSSP